MHFANSEYAKVWRSEPDHPVVTGGIEAEQLCRAELAAAASRAAGNVALEC